jgi:hypothetical protein
MAFIRDQGTLPHRGDTERDGIATAEKLNVLMLFADTNEDARYQAPCVERGTVCPQRGFRLGPVRDIAPGTLAGGRTALSCAAPAPDARRQKPLRPSPLVRQWRDQGESAFSVVSLTQVHGAVRQHDLERRANVALQQMARNCPSATTTQNTMDVQRRLIIRCIGDIASKGSDLGLLINRDALSLIPSFPVCQPQVEMSPIPPK